MKTITRTPLGRALAVLVVILFLVAGAILSFNKADAAADQALAANAAAETNMLTIGWDAEVIAVNQEKILGYEQVEALVDPNSSMEVFLTASDPSGFCLMGYDPAASFWNSAEQALYYSSDSETVGYSADHCIS